jgi:uncharacterized OB-fold protein
VPSITSAHSWAGPVPTLSPETKPYWDAAAEGTLLLQKCADCQKMQYPYRAQCCHCWSTQIEDYPSAGVGHIWSYSVVRRHRTGKNGGGPYAVIVVELEGGIKFMSNLEEADLDAVAIGDAVQVRFDGYAEGAIPVFVPFRDEQIDD